MFSVHSIIAVKARSSVICGKSPNICKLNNILLNNIGQEKPITGATAKRYFEPNKNEIIAYQNSWSEDKALIGGDL